MEYGSINIHRKDGSKLCLHDVQARIVYAELRKLNGSAMAQIHYRGLGNYFLSLSLVCERKGSWNA